MWKQEEFGAKSTSNTDGPVSSQFGPQYLINDGFDAEHKVEWDMGNGAKAIPLSRPPAAIVAVALHLNDQI